MPKEEAPRTIKVRALIMCYIHGNIRVRGDDELGEGNGQVFELYDRMIPVINPITSRPKRDPVTGKDLQVLATAEQQFSPYNMERMPDDTPVSEYYLAAQDVLTVKQDALNAAQTSRAKGQIRSHA